MKTRALALALTLVAGPLPAAEPSPLFLDAAFATPRLTGTLPSSPVWSPDRHHFAFAWDDAGRPQRSLWIEFADPSANQVVDFSNKVLGMETCHPSSRNGARRSSAWCGTSSACA